MMSPWRHHLLRVALAILLLGGMTPRNMATSVDVNQCESNLADNEEKQQCHQSRQGDDDATEKPVDDDETNKTQQEQDEHSSLARFLKYMFDAVEIHGETAGNNGAQLQQELIVQSWMSYVDMDPNLLHQSPLTTNWLETLFQRTLGLVADDGDDVFFKVWDERAKPTTTETEALFKVQKLAMGPSSGLDNVGDDDAKERERILLQQLFVPFRQRGFISTVLDTYTRMLLGPLKKVAFAIPSTANLQYIAGNYAPLVEVGAGTGYWSAALQQLYQVDIKAFDVHPPDQEQRNVYFDSFTYTNVHEGDCLSVFRDNDDGSSSSNDENRTLLLVWPNNPDNVDNSPAFYSPRLPPVWDVECVEAFVRAGGETIIFVAERETNIRVLPTRHPDHPTYPDSGFSASRKLQRYLQEQFDLVHQMDILTWYYQDDLTVWKRKRGD